MDPSGCSPALWPRSARSPWGEGDVGPAAAPADRPPRVLGPDHPFRRAQRHLSRRGAVDHHDRGRGCPSLGKEVHRSGFGISLELGETRTGVEWLVDAIAFGIGAIVASEFVTAWRTFEPVWAGLAVVPAVIGGLVVGLSARSAADGSRSSGSARSPAPPGPAGPCRLGRRSDRRQAPELAGETPARPWRGPG